EENVDELVAKAAACHRMSDIQVLLAQRFAEPDLLSEADFRVVHSHAPGHVSAPVGSGDPHDANASAEVVHSHAPGHASAPVESGDPHGANASAEVVHSHAPGHASAPVESGEWVHLRIRVRKDKLAYARDLLSHSLPSGDACVVFDRALDALI